MSRLRRLADANDMFELDDLVKIKLGNDWVLGKIFDINSYSKDINGYIYFVETHEDTYPVKNNDIRKYEGKDFDIIHIDDDVEFNTAINTRWGKVTDITRDGSIVFIETDDDNYNVNRYEVRKRS